MVVADVLVLTCVYRFVGLLEDEFRIVLLDQSGPNKRMTGQGRGL